MTEQTKNDELDGQEPNSQLDAEFDSPVADDEAEDTSTSSDQTRGGERTVTSTGGRRIKGPSKQTIARESRRRRSDAKKSRKRLLYGIGGGFIAAALITGLVLPSLGHLGGGGSSNATDSPTAQGSLPSVGTQHAIQSASVIETGASHDAYQTSPPTSGPRLAEGVEWGVYDAEQPPEALVRNLEEGGIVVHHNLSDPSQIDDLAAFIEAQPGYPGCFVVQPYQVAAESVTITSWGWSDSYSLVDRAAMQEFIDDHRNVAPLFLGNTCGADTELAAGAAVAHDAGL